MNTNEKLKEYRCYVNNKLLCKAAGNLQVEIMNPTNRVMNYTGPTRRPGVGLKGNEFASKSYTMNCSECKRLQGRVLGIDGVVEIKCRYCGHTTLHNITEIVHNKLMSLPERAREAWINQIKKYM